jgi:catabolite regulation protein CreA
VAFDGKPYQTTGGDAREISYKRVDEYTIERTQNRNGKISVDTEQVSKDGKTLTVKQENAVRVYDKKFNVQPAGH